jgi:hypothetical protein
LSGPTGDSNDTAFLKAVHNHGLSDSGGDQAMINLGHMICDLRGQGYSENALVDSGALHATQMSTDDVRFLVQTSEAAYCPEYIQ